MRRVTGMILFVILLLSPALYAGASGAPECSEIPTTTAAREEVTTKMMKLTIGDTVWTATLADNTSADALRKLLQDGPVTVAMRDYAQMEKVGSLGQTLPRNDEQITTAPGDLILYQGDALVIYYAPNSWNFTRLGSIDNVTPEELKTVLGAGDVDITLSLVEE